MFDFGVNIIEIKPFEIVKFEDFNGDVRSFLEVTRKACNLKDAENDICPKKENKKKEAF